MSTTTTQTCLERNLACFGEANADVARLIRQTRATSDISFERTPQGVPSATYQSRLLASRVRPRDEADRLAAKVDVVEHAVIVSLGFGLGYHLEPIARQLEHTGVIVVFEPDLAMLRAVLEEVDCSSWMSKTNLLWIHDPNDRGAVASKFTGAESLLAQGVAFIDHPANRQRLADPAKQFSKTFSDYVSTAKTTLLTTLVRAVDTIQNQLWNLDHYALGPGIASLRDVATGYPAVIVSAGPSLRRNVHYLAEDGIRDRCLIIAVQTTLKPLLEAGIRPHFVTALDYHEISARFYEGLTEEDVRGVTLIVDPKAHPIIPDSFPGTVRCCRAPFLDKLLGRHARPMGDLPAGATVAHLAFYLAEFLGCNPIGLVGQDLGFTDGLYYSRGTAIHDVWATELNSFRTIEMMEWERIVRHRAHLLRAVDIHGRSIFTDAQMAAYLQQFERDFSAASERGTRVIDASEGGVRKQHTESATLKSFLSDHASRTLPSLDCDELAAPTADLVCQRIQGVRQEAVQLTRLSRQTGTLLKNMLEDQRNTNRMERHFRQLEELREQVEDIFETFELLSHLNQLGVFRRIRRDRRIHLAERGDALERQRAQLERDLDNVIWTADAAEEFAEMLEDAMRLMGGEHPRTNRRPSKNSAFRIDSSESEPATIEVKPLHVTQVAALVAIDPTFNGLGVARSLDVSFAGKPLLQATLERIGSAKELDTIVILVPEDYEGVNEIDRSRINVRVEIERCDHSVFDDRREAIAASRRWADTCWRGAPCGFTAWDEAIAPVAMYRVMERRNINSAIVVAPDWPEVDASATFGIESLIARHRERPDRLPHVFTQAPPGLGACLIARSLMSELAKSTRFSTVGALLSYQPHAPQADPVARDANVQIDHRIRQSLNRFTYDAARWRELLDRCVASGADHNDLAAFVAAADHPKLNPFATPQHLIVQINCNRSSCGYIAHSRNANSTDDVMSLETFEELLSQYSELDDLRITFDGAGDPMLHPEFDRFVSLADEAGVLGIHVRTELRCDRAAIDRLLKHRVDIVSVDLHADRAATYQRMMGDDRFKDVLLNIEYLNNNRRVLCGSADATGFALPWVVPHLARCDITYEDINSFYDRWTTLAGTAVIEGTDIGSTSEHPLTMTSAPSRVRVRESWRSMVVGLDGTVRRVGSAGSVGPIPGFRCFDAGSDNQ